MKVLKNVSLVLLLFGCLCAPALADDGQGQVVYPGGRLVVDSGEVIHDDVVALGGSVDVLEGGRVDGDVTLLNSNSRVDGRVAGNLVAIGGTLELGAHAVVDGDLMTLGGTTSKSAQATVRGQTVDGLRGQIPAVEVPRLLSRAWPWGGSWREGQGGPVDWLGRWLQALAGTLGMMALALLLVSVLPRQTSLIVDTVTWAPTVSLGVGVLTMIVLPIVFTLLVLICIGIPIAVLLAVAAAAAGTYGWVAVGAAAGQRLLAALKSPSAPAWGAIVGVGLLSLLSALPCLGWLLGLIAAAMGLGAVVLTRFGTLQYVKRQHGVALTLAMSTEAPNDSTRAPQEQAGQPMPDQEAPAARPGDSSVPDGPVSR